MSQKDDVIYINHPEDSWGFNSVVALDGGQQNALMLSLQEKRAIGLLLKHDRVGSDPEFNQLSTFPVKLAWGAN